jgi:hypothetical protein
MRPPYFLQFNRSKFQLSTAMALPSWPVVTKLKAAFAVVAIVSRREATQRQNVLFSAYWRLGGMRR